MSLAFGEVFDIDEYQNIQDTFSKNMGVGSVTVLPSGKPITKPSNFCRLCENYLRKSTKGKSKCFQCNAEIGQPSHSGPLIMQCHDGKGLWNAGVSIVVEGVHLATWCIGQVKNEEVDETYLVQFAKVIKVNIDGYKSALDEVPYMSKERFIQVANVLYLFVNQLAITARKNMLLNHQIEKIQKTNELLIESERRYRILFEQSNDAIFVVKLPEGKYIDANEAASKLTGRTHGEIVKLKTNDLSPNGATNRLAQVLNDSLKESFNDVEYLRPDGTCRHARLSILTIDQHLRFGIAHDITEHLIASQALKHSHDLMQYIIEHSKSAIAVHDKELRYIYVSQKYLEEYGVKENQVIGKHHYEVFPDLPQKWREVHQKALQGVVSSEEEDPYVRDDGHTEWTRWECRPWYDQYNQIGGIIVYTEVITGRKKLEIALRESEEKYKFLFYNNPQPSWIYDLENLSFLEVNNAAIMHYGYTRDEFLQMTLKDIRPKEEIPKLLDDVYEKITPEYSNGAQWRHKKKNGEIIDVEIFSHAVEYQDKKARHVLINEVTDKIKTQREIIAAKEKAEESDRLKSAFLANMSHEIRTPLNGLLGFSELLIDPEFNGEDKKEFIDIMKHNSDRLLMLIDSILDLSQIESGQIKLQQHSFIVADLLATIQKNYLPDAKMKGLKLTVNEDSLKNPATIIADPYRITQIINVLLTNALKFTEKGMVEFGFQPNKSLIQFYVKDTGIGIPKQYHQLIFERFWQVDRGLNRKYEGSGLGLTVAKSLVELFDGKIWLESTVDRGSTFYFTIPKRTKNEDPLQ